MKKYFIMLAVLLNFQLIISAQAYPFHKIGASVSFLGKNVIGSRKPLMGAPSYDSRGFFKASIDYLYSKKKWLDFETGLEYSHHKYEVSSHDFPQQSMPNQQKEFSLLSVPVTANFNFYKYFFAKAGISADIDLNSEFSFSGLGLITGLGVKYDFKNGPTVFISPYSKTYSLLRTIKDNEGYGLWEWGFRAGLNCPLKRR